MNNLCAQYQGRFVGRLAVVVATCVGLVAAPASRASAAETEFAYQVVDCDTPGTDFGVVSGTPDRPGLPIQASNLRAEALAADGTVVASVPLRSKKNSRFEVPGRWATVSPDVEFDRVRFTWTDDLSVITKESPSVQPEVCEGPDKEWGSTSPDPGEGLRAVRPIRLLDSRGSSDRVAAGKVLRVKVGGVNGVPAAATAAMLNVTAANPGFPGFLTVFPCGVPVPKTSSVNFVTGETRAGSVFTKIGSNAEVCVFTSALTAVVVDLTGYVADSAQPTAFTPRRVVDTRPDALTDVAGTPKGKQTVLRVPTEKFDVVNPSNLIVNITTVDADAPGHVTVGTCSGIDESKPAADELRSSTLNFVPGRAQANLAIVPMWSPFSSEWGPLCVAASAPTHMIVDLVGATSGPSSLLGGMPVKNRLLDTRAGQQTSDGKFEAVGQLQANTPLKLNVRDRLNAIGATMAAFNVTAANESAYGHITVYPCGKLVPVASNLNYAPGAAIANLALSELDADGNVCIVSHVATDLVVDLAAVNSSVVQTTGDIADGVRYWYPFTTAALVGNGEATSFDFKLEGGGSPPYTLSGPTVADMSVKLTAEGDFMGSMAEGVYMIGTFRYTLASGNGTSQSLTVEVVNDPQVNRPRPPL